MEEGHNPVGPPKTKFRFKSTEGEEQKDNVSVLGSKHSTIGTSTNVGRNDGGMNNHNTHIEAGGAQNIHNYHYHNYQDLPAPSPESEYFPRTQLHSDTAAVEDDTFLRQTEALKNIPEAMFHFAQLVHDASQEEDVSLVSDDMKKEDFKDIKHSESLHTAMAEVATEGWSAFNFANDKVKEIRRLSNQIPENTNNAVKSVFGAKKEGIEGRFAGARGNLSRISREISDCFESVKKRMEHVGNVIDEAVVAGTRAKIDKETKRALEKNLDYLRTYFHVIRFLWSFGPFELDLRELQDPFAIMREEMNGRLRHGISDERRDLILRGAAEMNKIAFKITRSCSIYVEMFEKHVKPMGDILEQFFDPKTISGMALMKLRLRTESAISSIPAIEAIVHKKHFEYETKVQNQLKRFEMEM